MNKKILLFSGGLDSFITYKLFNPDLCLYVNINTDESTKEKGIVKDLVDKDKLIIRNFSLVEYELSNKIIPLRNAFFTLLGFEYGNEVMLSATAGDTTPDKDETFSWLISNLVSYIFKDPAKNPSWWNNEMQMKLILPVRQYSKTELVSKYLSMGFSKEDLLKSRSCYSGEDEECGVCRSCFRKWVALVNNEIIPDFHNKILSHAINFYNQTIEKKRNIQEIIDTRKALEKCNIYV
jgi:7-cyano-7-deazaguanine synthase in queuosine biosynthesis